MVLLWIVCRWLLFAGNCLLFAGGVRWRCSSSVALAAVRCSPFVVRCSLCVVWHVLRVVVECVVLIAVRCAMCVVCCMLLAVVR